jgi:hypothetical protein
VDVPLGLILFGCIGVFIVLSLLSVFVVLWLIRGTNPNRAVASVEAAPGAPFTLSFTTSAAGPHRVYLRFDLGYGGGRSNYGVTAQVQVQAGGGPALPIEMRVGDLAPALGPHGVRTAALYRVSRSSVMGRASLRATTEIASLPAVPPGTPVQIAGRVVVSDRCTTNSLLVFVGRG